MAGLIPNEHCDPEMVEDVVLKCRGLEAQAAGTHCDHWYEDEGCCACGTEELNLVILETEEDGRV